MRKAKAGVFFLVLFLAFDSFGLAGLTLIKSNFEITGSQSSADYQLTRLDWLMKISGGIAHMWIVGPQVTSATPQILLPEIKSQFNTRDSLDLNYRAWRKIQTSA